MRRLIVLPIILSMICLLALPCFGAAPAKIQFVRAIYDGGKGIGLRYPEGVACTDDYFIVADTGNNRLVKYTYQDKNAKTAELDMEVNVPTITQVNSKGEIFTLDERDRRIQVFNADGTPKEYLSPKNSPVARKKMVPRSFKIDQNDNFFILEISEGLVLVLDPSGSYLRHIPFPEQAGFFSDLAVDQKGSIFLVDSTRAAVYAVEPDGDQFSQLNRGLSEFMNFPTNITIDNQGILYLVDKHGGSLVLLSRDGSFLGHRFGYGWHDGQFYYPAQICTSQNGYLFVADRNNNRVQMFIISE